MKTNTTRRPREKRRLLKPPPKLSEDVEQLFASHDFQELEYRRMADLRSRRKLTPEQREILVEHDATERRIVESPNDVMREAYRDIDRGIALLLKLVRAQKLVHRHAGHDGSVFVEWDDAFDCLKSRADYLNRQLVRLAEVGTPNARTTLFYQSKVLAEAFIRLAQAHPNDFINSAESSLTMPSLRARNPKFTADAEAIAKSIHLGEKHPGGMLTDDRERIGELCGYLVATILDAIGWARRHYKSESESLKRLQEFRESAEEYRGVTIEEFLRRNLYPTTFEDVVAAANLPDFHSDPAVWWKRSIRPKLREEFERLKRNPTRNAALWTELIRMTDNGGAGAKWKALSDNCRNKLNQFARRSDAATFA